MSTRSARTLVLPIYSSVAACRSHPSRVAQVGQDRLRAEYSRRTRSKAACRSVGGSVMVSVTSWVEVMGSIMVVSPAMGGAPGPLAAFGGGGWARGGALVRGSRSCVSSVYWVSQTMSSRRLSMSVWSAGLSPVFSSSRIPANSNPTSVRSDARSPHQSA